MKVNNISPKVPRLGRPAWSADSAWVGHLLTRKQYLCVCLILLIAGALHAQNSPPIRPTRRKRSGKRTWKFRPINYASVTPECER